MVFRYVILGGRSGSTLLLNLLSNTGEFKCWNGGTKPLDAEVPLQEELFYAIPDAIKIEAELAKGNFDWTLAKLPIFDLVLDQVIEMYDPKIIALQRPINDRVHSHVRLGWHRIIANKVRNCTSFLEEMSQTICMPTDQILHKSDKDIDYMYFKMHQIYREVFLENVSEDKILTINYADILSDFESTMRDVSIFCDLDFEEHIDTWNTQKNRRQQAGGPFKYE